MWPRVRVSQVAPRWRMDDAWLTERLTEFSIAVAIQAPPPSPMGLPSRIRGQLAIYFERNFDPHGIFA